MRARRVRGSVASIIYTVLALAGLSCIAVEDVAREDSTDTEVVLVDPSDSMPDADAPVTAPPGEPRNSEPPCDDDGDCCPDGTTAVVGTQNADVFSTSAQGLCHVTLGGSDVVNNTSAAGLHAALGGPGSDTLYGGFGPAILAGGADGDTLTGRNADDELYGQGGNDSLNGGGGNDKGFGGDGNDSISLGEGNNEADGGAGTDTLNTGGGTDILRGGPGNDVLNAGGGADDLRGNSGDDTLNGQGGNDTLVGGPGKDIVNAGSGDDLVIVYDVCELVAGEVYNGEGGNDTLQIPVTLAEAQSLGAVFTGFENVVVDETLAPLSECGRCDCEAVGNAVACCNGHGSCDLAASPAECTCDVGFAGPNCGISCAGPEQCDLDVFYNGSGTVNGAIFRAGTDGGPLFQLGGQDSASVGDAFRGWMSTQEGIMLFADMADTAPLGELVPTGEPPFNYRGLVVHRFRQTYRGFEVVGPESQVSVVTTPSLGAFAFAGTPLDNRIDYDGLAAQISPATALDFIEGHFEEQIGPLNAQAYEFTTPVLGAFPHARALVYTAEAQLAGGFIARFGVRAGTGTAAGDLLFLDRQSFDVEDEVPATVLAEATSSDPFTTEVTQQYVSLLTGDPLLGSIYEPDGCPNAPGCGEVRLGNMSVIALDSHGASPGIQVTTPRDPNGEFLVSPGVDEFTYLQQDYFLKILSAFREADATFFASNGLKLWDPKNGVNSDFVFGTYTPRLLFFWDVPSAFCGDNPACVNATSEVLPSADVDPHVAFQGATPEPLGYLAFTQVNSVRQVWHEMGHIFDVFASFRALGSGVPTDPCVPDTSAESESLREAVAQIVALWGFQRFYDQALPYTNCLVVDQVSLQGPVLPHAGACIQDTDQVLLHPQTADVCNFSSGYREDAAFQAWWELAHGQRCAVDAPFACADFPLPVGTPPPRAAMEGLTFALKTGGNAQSFRQFFELIALYEECEYGPAVAADVREVLCHHDLISCVEPPLECPICGNGVVDPGEQCDGLDLAGQECTDFGYIEGALGCNDDCTVDTSGCSACGDGNVDVGEQCDGDDLAGETCESLGFDQGTLLCEPECTFDTAGCGFNLPDCMGQPGEIGCECLPVDPNLFFDEDGGFPDGPGSYGLASVDTNHGDNPGTYCPDSEANTGLAICGLTMVGQQPNNIATPVCVECALAGNGQGESSYGCPCSSDADCAASGVSGSVTGDFNGTTIKLTCWGDDDGGWSGAAAVCLPRVNEVDPNSQPHPDEGQVLGSELEEFERTKWLCKIPCVDLEVPGAAAHACTFNQSPINFDYATCVEESCEGDPGEQCADDGGHCGPNDFCVDECDPANNTGNGNPDCLEYGYPQVWECTEWLARDRCGPPECVQDPFVGPGDTTLCDALTYGNLIPA
jgi:hypothetical protein